MNPYVPILIVVLANTVYQICAKATPPGVNSFTSLSVTYAVGSAVSLALYFMTQKDANLLAEYRQLNWSSFVLGIVVVGLEGGFILMYRAGWSVSTGQLVQSAFLAAVLLFVGFFLYQEPITARKLIGIAVCLAGLYLVNG